jgi:hypothetical protein
MGKQTEKDLLKADEVLATTGWCKNQYENSKGAHCFAGALRQATLGSSDAIDGSLPKSRLERYRRVLRAVVAQLPKKFRESSTPRYKSSALVSQLYDLEDGIIEFNDSRSGTKARVRQVIRAAAAGQVE